LAQAEAYATEGKGGTEDFTMSIPRAWQRRERRLKPPIRRAGEPEAEWAARRRISHRGKTLRAFRAYLDLLDTAAYMQNELSTQLAAFDVTMRGLRVLEMLYRRGPTATRVAAVKLKCSRSNVEKIVLRLEERGWVARELWTLPPAEINESRLPVERRGKKREGRAIGIIRLTPRGQKFIGTFFPKHAKVVKSLMRALDGKEQVTLSRLLLKLRQGDVGRFVREIRMYDEEDWDEVMREGRK
jgi:MarR family transcriptional regulator, 2-MHQ and catechol-resistance regulon repressor